MFKDFQSALFRLKDYQTLMWRKGSRFIAHCAFLCLLTWLTGFALPLGVFWQRQGGIRHFVESNIPDFTIQNGKLSVPGGYHREGANYYVDIDTSPSHQIALDAQETRTLMALKSLVVLGDADHLVIQNDSGGIAGNLRTVNFRDFQDGIDKSALLSLSGYVKWGLVLASVFVYVGLLLGFFLLNLVEAVLAALLLRFFGVYADFGSTYRLTGYARTLSTLIIALLALLGFSTDLTMYPAVVLDLFIMARAAQSIRAAKKTQDGNSPQAAETITQRAAPDTRAADRNTEDAAENADREETQAEQEDSHQTDAEQTAASDKKAGESGVAEKPPCDDITPSDGWSF